jgi:hypothetical protein
MVLRQLLGVGGELVHCDRRAGFSVETSAQCLHQVRVVWRYGSYEVGDSTLSGVAKRSGTALEALRKGGVQKVARLNPLPIRTPLVEGRESVELCGGARPVTAHRRELQGRVIAEIYDVWVG